MLYYTFSVGAKEYKARLSARAVVDLEKKLGTNPLNIFMEIAQKGQLPSVEVLITMLHASLQQFNHGISMDDTYEIYDEMVDDGKTIMDVVAILLEIFKVSGLIPEETEDAKNA